TARHFHEQGFLVAVHARRRPLHPSIPADSPRYTADLTSWPEVSAMVQQVVADIGPPLAVVNCTGYASDALLVTQPPQDWMAAVTTNISCAYHPVRAFLPAMLPPGPAVSSSSPRQRRLSRPPGRARTPRPKRRWKCWSARWPRN